MTGAAYEHRRPAVSRWLGRIVTYGRMVRFSHTVFALPFALAAVVLAQRRHPLQLADLFWILVAMVGARSAAMGFNRLADAPWDAVNPRTSGREIPAGKLSVVLAERFVIFFSGVFLLAAAMLGRLCFYLSLPVLLVLFAYSYTKRFTWLSHLVLGFAISLAPVGAWIAVAKGFSWPILLLSAALMAWMAGFDILYACQDAVFDKNHGLFSIPVRFGGTGGPARCRDLPHRFLWRICGRLFRVRHERGLCGHGRAHRHPAFCREPAGPAR